MKRKSTLKAMVTGVAMAATLWTGMAGAEESFFLAEDLPAQAVVYSERVTAEEEFMDLLEAFYGAVLEDDLFYPLTSSPSWSELTDNPYDWQGQTPEGAPYGNPYDWRNWEPQVDKPHGNPYDWRSWEPEPKGPVGNPYDWKNWEYRE